MELENDRFVSVIYPKKTAHPDPLRKFSEFLNKPNIVLLGSPGSGKSYLFKSTAKHNNSSYLSVRQFLYLPPLNIDTEVFIDALDESRNGRGDDTAIDNIVKKLFANPLSKCRISCRESDWLGETDLTVLNDYFDLNGGVTVLRLGTLTTEEQELILLQNEIKEPKKFISDATDKGAAQFLDNPQTLIMLAKVVKIHDWPETRKKLFNQTAKLLLQEHNLIKRNKNPGSYSADDLFPIAGAIMAGRLISGVEGISLDTESNLADYPSFKTLTYIDADRLQETLRRSLFINTSVENIVDYCHRTIAEFLAAHWIADQVRNGLPIKRALSLFGLDGYPTSELRGLNAWLTIFLPEHAELFIKVDPYGIVLYGEAKSLTPSNRKILLSHLGQLVLTEPWFRQYRQEHDNLSGVICNELVDIVKPIIVADTTHYSFRVLILEALAEGEYLAELEDACYQVLEIPSATYIELRAAITVIAKFPKLDKDRLKSFFDKAVSSESDIRLKADMLSLFYDKVLFIEDYINTLKLATESKDDLAAGGLWKLEFLPSLADIPTILDTPLLKSKDDENSDDRFHDNGYEVSSIYQNLLQRYLSTVCPLSIADITRWLSQTKRHSYVTGLSVDEEKRGEIHKVNVNNFIRMLAHYFLTFDINEIRNNGLYKLTFLINGLVSQETILLILTRLLEAQLDNERQEVLYGLAMELLCRCTKTDSELINYLLDYPSSKYKPSFVAIAEKFIFHEFSDWEIESRQKKEKRKLEKANAQKRNIENILLTKKEIEQGVYFPNLSWLAFIYYGKFSDEKKEGSPRERILNYFAGYDTAFIFTGFKALLLRGDLPTVEAILKLQIESKYQEWWYAILAGFDEIWQEAPSLTTWSDAQKKLGLTLHRKLNTYSYEGNHSKALVRKWIERIHVEYPDFSAQCYFYESDFLITHGQNHPSALHYLLRQEELQNYNANYILQLLTNHPNCQDLSDILVMALRNSCIHNELSALGSNQLKNNKDLLDKNYNLWLAACLLLNPIAYLSEFQTTAFKNKELIWAIRDLSSQAFELFESLPEQIMYGIVKVSASHFINVNNPKSSMGESNVFDGAEFVKKVINKLSSKPTNHATEFLNQLLKDDDLETYRENLKQALANQYQIYREHHFHKPTWAETINTLFNLEPSNIADFQSLVAQHLLGIALDINSNNTDLYKQFWNEDEYRRPTSPKVEESCRHVLLGLLRHRLNPLNIISEPEVHSYQGKRADIVCFKNDLKLPIEIKRDSHDKIWCAAESQLFKYYMREPVTSGKGIYLVFWFGEKRKGTITLQPVGPKPSSADQLKNQLIENLSDSLKDHIEVMVIDVSGES